MLIRCIVDVERDVSMRNLSIREAVKILEDMKVKIEIPKAAVTQNKRNEALDLGIKALQQFGNSEQLPSTQPTQTNTPNALKSLDCISRAAVIKAVDRHSFDTDNGLCLDDDITCILEEVPSAQPEKRTEKRTETHACDLISRQDAIDALGDEPEVWTDKDEYAMGLNNQWHYDRNAILRCPSAQPEPEEFEWCHDCKEYDQEHYCCHRWTKVIRHTVEELKQEQRWIPVTERLPEDSDYHDFWETPDGAVMWCKETGEIGVGWYYESTKTWCDLWDNGVRDVIAWMPLPEPWEGRRE